MHMFMQNVIAYSKCMDVQIVLQDSIDDNSISATANVALQRRQVDLEGCDHDFENDNRQTDGGYFDQFPRTYNDKKREMVTSSKHNSGHEGDGILPFPSEVPIQYCPNSKVQTPMYPSKLSDTPHEGRYGILIPQMLGSFCFLVYKSSVLTFYGF